MQKKILMLLANSFKPDDRVNNEALSLIDAGYKIKILAWDREGNYPKKEIQNKIEIERFRFKAATNSRTVIFPMIIFEFWLFFKILFERFNYLHCHDFDTLIPGFFAGKIKFKKIIYDAHEDYAGAAEEFLPKWATDLIRKIENFLTKHIIGLVTPHPILINRFNYVPGKVLVMNCKALERNIKDFKEIAELKQKLKIENKFVLMFTGAITRHRMVVETAKMLLEKPIKNLVFFVLGWSIDDSGVELNKLVDNKNIVYHPGVSIQELPLYMQLGDINHCYQDPQNPNYKIAIPNKMFDAMTAQKPLIVANNQACAPIVKKDNCGFVLPYGNVKKLRLILKWAVNNPEAIKKMGDNARKAVEKEYNWGEMAERLIGLYAEI